MKHPIVKVYKIITRNQQRDNATFTLTPSHPVTFHVPAPARIQSHNRPFFRFSPGWKCKHFPIACETIHKPFDFKATGSRAQRTVTIRGMQKNEVHRQKKSFSRYRAARREGGSENMAERISKSRRRWIDAKPLKCD